MKSLSDILDAVRNGERPEYDELRYAVCALSSLATFDGMALQKLAEAEAEQKPKMLVWSAKWQHEECFNRWKTALGKSPKEWLGPSNDPDNPEVVERRKRAVKLFERFASREEPHK